jgi:molybdate transport system permease protein
MIVHLPLVLPPVVVGWMLLMVFGLRGPVGSFLNDWFGIRLVFTATGAALACAVMSFPLMVRAIRLSLEAVDRGLEDAASTLEAKAIDRFFTVTLPLMAPGVISGAITGYAASLGEFGAVITFASNVPGQTQNPATCDLLCIANTRKRQPDCPSSRQYWLLPGFCSANG